MSGIDERWERDPSRHDAGGAVGPAETDAADVPVPATEAGIPPVPEAGKGDDKAARLPQDVEDRFTVR